MKSILTQKTNCVVPGSFDQLVDFKLSTLEIHSQSLPWSFKIGDHTAHSLLIPIAAADRPRSVITAFAKECNITHCKRLELH